MPRSVTKFAVTLAALLLAVLALPARADIIVENFDDNNWVAENWDSGQWISVATFGCTPTGYDGFNYIAPSVGRGTKIRSSGAGCTNFNSEGPTILTSQVGGGFALQYGLVASTAGMSSAIPTSGCAVTTSQIHYVQATLARNTNFDASSYYGTGYLRFTAWIGTRSGATSVPTNAQAVVWLYEKSPVCEQYAILGNAPYPSNVSVGPYEASTLGLNTLASPLSQTPQVFVLPINTSVFRKDSEFQAMANNAIAQGVPLQQGPTPPAGPYAGAIADWSKLRMMAFGYRRSGAAALTGQLDANFLVDDIMFLNAYPGVTVNTTGTTFVNENLPTNTSTTFTVVLDAMPSHNVVINIADGGSTRVNVSPASITFLPSGTPGPGEALWNSPVTVTVSQTDNGLTDGEANVPISLTVDTGTKDLFYKNSTIGNVNILVKEAGAAVKDWQRQN